MVATLKAIATRISRGKTSISLPLLEHQVCRREGLNSFKLDGALHYYHNQKDVYNILQRLILIPTLRICTGNCNEILEHALAYCPKRLLETWSHFNHLSNFVKITIPKELLTMIAFLEKLNNILTDFQEVEVVQLEMINQFA